MNKLMMKFAVPLPTLSACAAMALLPWTRAAEKRDWIALKIGQAEAIQDIGRPGRQGVDDLLDSLAEIRLTGLDRLVQICCFLQQRRGRERQGQDHQGQDDQHARKRGKVALSAPWRSNSRR